MQFFYSCRLYWRPMGSPTWTFQRTQFWIHRIDCQVFMVLRSWRGALLWPGSWFSWVG